VSYRRLVTMAASRPRLVLAVWTALAVGCAVVVAILPGNIANRGYTASGYESDRANQILREDVPGRTGTNLLAELSSQYTVKASVTNEELAVKQTETRRSAEGRRVLGALSRLPSVASVEPITDAQVFVRRNRTMKFDDLIVVRLRPPAASAEHHIVDIEDVLDRFAPERVTYGLVGPLAVSRRYTQIAHDDLARAELIAFPVVFVVLLIAFMSVVAAVLPIVLGGITLVITLAVLHLISLETGLSVFVVNAAAAVAMGLSIDYALFIVSRYREERGRGASEADAVALAMASSGRAVLLSGGTVALALLALVIVGVGVFSSMALGGIIATLIAISAASTLLPAVICLLGERLDRFTLRTARAAADRGTIWRRLGHLVTQRPWICALVSGLVLVALAIPATSLSLDFRNVSELPSHDPISNHLRRIANIYGPGGVGPITVVTKNPKAAESMIENDEGVRGIWRTAKGHDGWSAVDAVLTTGPETNATQGTIERLRRDFAHLGNTYIAGLAPEEMDLSQEITSTTPVVVLAAVLVVLVGLGLGLRSILIPIKSVICSLLSVAATLGILLLLFPSSGPGDSLAFFVPLFIFVLVFGLSIDYEVFLLSRVREAVAEGRSTKESVMIGLMRSGRPITLAAVAVAVVFGAFSFSTLMAARQLGVGVAVAVLLDATIVRCLLVPSCVVLLDRWNWWLPGRPRLPFVGERRRGEPS
jgi:uncharacterized membrane protein YdfJ with MMPL/SSD domain